MSGGSSVDRLDQCGGSRDQHLISDSPGLLSSQGRPNSSQVLSVLVDSKEISNPQVCLYSYYVCPSHCLEVEYSHI